MYTRPDLDLLINKAVQFVRRGSGIDMRHLQYLYRTKDISYWRQIYDNNQGVMYPELKDNNGHLANPINGRIRGIWLSAFTYRDGAIPGFSPFGNQRYHVPPSTLLDPRKFSMFFADFYCHNFKKQHYVTVVVCLRNREIESNLRKILPQLDPDNNPFIRVRWHNEGGFSVWSTGKLFVEVYFSAEIDLNHMQGAFFRPVQNIGTPISWSGRKSDGRCKVCNP